MKKKPIYLRAGLALNLSLLSYALGATPINPGDIIVSEILANPAAVADSAGEWFELYNTSAINIDISGLILRDSGSNHHTIASPTPLLIAPGAYRVLGRSWDSAANGGYLPDYVYSNFNLSNGGDDIILESNGIDIFHLSYSSADNFGQAGVSMVLSEIPAAISAADYQASGPEILFGDGDRGSPGSGNLGSTNAVSDVPLPASGLLFCSSLTLLAGIKRRRSA